MKEESITIFVIISVFLIGFILGALSGNQDGNQDGRREAIKEMNIELIERGLKYHHPESGEIIWK